MQDLRRRARTLQLCAACATAWNTFAMVFSARIALVKTALLNHKAAPPLEVVELILEFSRPRVDMLRQAFDNYLSEFLDTSFASPTTSYCCGFYRRRVELKPNERICMRVNDQSSTLMLGNVDSYKHFLAANRSLKWFIDVMDGHDVLTKRRALNDSTLKIYLAKAREKSCPRRCYCCMLLNLDCVDPSFFWTNKLRQDLLRVC